MLAHGFQIPEDEEKKEGMYASFEKDASNMYVFSLNVYISPIQESDPNWQNSCDYLGGIRELNYMTQIVLMLYEDPSKDPMSDDRFRVELHFSPGAKDCEDDENHPGCCPFRSVHNSVSEDLCFFFCSLNILLLWKGAGNFNAYCNHF